MSDGRFTRREALTRGAGAILGAGLAAAIGYQLHDRHGKGTDPTGSAVPGLRDFFAEVDFPAPNPRISVAVGDEQQIERLVRAAVDGLDGNLGMRRFIRPGDVVLIKPNVGFDRPPYVGATTHPEVLRAVIRLCREAGAAEVLVTDNPIEAPQACFAKSGLGPVARTEGAQVIMPTEARFRLLAARPGPPDATRGEVLGRWPVLWEPLERATKLIGVAPVKDHNLCSASMGLKNWYGLLGGRRNQFHQAIDAVISDLGVVFSPTLVVADGTRVMLRSGPTGGRTSDVRPGGQLGRPTIVAAVDPVACDAWCYEQLLGRDPARLPYLALAQAKIGRRIAAGARRYAEQDWKVYQREGKLVMRSV